MKDEILRLRVKGLTYGEICSQLNVNKSLVAYYCNNKRYTDNKQQKEKTKIEYEKIVCGLVNECENINQVCKKLYKKGTNQNYKHINNIIKKYNLNISHFNEIPNRKNNTYLKLEDIFCENSSYQISSLKNKLIKEGLKLHKCEKCGRCEWEGEKIPLETHHKNGVSNDNRLENLQLLCPNCHTLTENYCGKNIKYINNKKVYKLCKNCGLEYNNSNLHFCSNECKLEYQLNSLPTKNELINKMKELKSFKKVGEFYQISDNGVRKWYKKHNLPLDKNIIMLL